MLQSVTLMYWMQVCGYCSSDALFTQDDAQQGQHFADFRLVFRPPLRPSAMFRMVHVSILLPDVNVVCMSSSAVFPLLGNRQKSKVKLPFKSFKSRSLN